MNNQFIVVVTEAKNCEPVRFEAEPKACVLRRAVRFAYETPHPLTVAVLGPEPGQVLASWSRGTFLVGANATKDLTDEMRADLERQDAAHWEQEVERAQMFEAKYC